MHFPTLPRRWRLSSEAVNKPPKRPQNSASKNQPRKFKLNRSASFSSDPVFKVPQVPSRLSRPPTDGAEYHENNNPCPNCSNFQEWRSRSLMDLQHQKGSNSSWRQPQNEATPTASIFSNNLRSNSWRNLSLIGKKEPKSVSSVWISFFSVKYQKKCEKCEICVGRIKIEKRGC